MKANNFNIQGLMLCDPIQVSHVVKTVPDASGTLSILTDICMTVSRGETIAIVGASGSGKSTLLSIIAGLDVPSSGHVYINGVDFFALSEDGRARLRGQSMGFVFQNFQLLGHMTALENVTLAGELQADPLARIQAIELLERVGLGARLHHYPKVLSGGEQQRVALARAFVRKPSILLADEPTGNLDHATGRELIDFMFEINRASGTALVLVTHDYDLASRCQRQLVMSAGTLTERK